MPRARGEGALQLGQLLMFYVGAQAPGCLVPGVLAFTPPERVWHAHLAALGVGGSGGSFSTVQ
jgi:hypothetical protein